MTKDWLVLAPILGYMQVQALRISTAGDIKNSGIEFNINWKDEVGDFIYGASFSGYNEQNEVTRLPC